MKRKVFSQYWLFAVIAIFAVSCGGSTQECTDCAVDSTLFVDTPKTVIDSTVDSNGDTKPADFQTVK